MAQKQIKARQRKIQTRQQQTTIQQIQIEFKRAIKPYIASLKPTLTALVFLLVSSFAQQLMDKLQLAKPCPATSEVSGITRFVGAFMAGVASVESKAVELEGQTVMAGSRALTITRHAAERMVERGINKEAIGTAVNTGKLFAYSHAKLIKIGYYNTVSRVFVAVDQQHRKILTVIHNVPAKYILKLINYISKPLSLNWPNGQWLPAMVGAEWFVFLASFFIWKIEPNMI